jgi:hypothetical protein
VFDIAESVAITDSQRLIRGIVFTISYVSDFQEDILKTSYTDAV